MQLYVRRNDDAGPDRVFVGSVVVNKEPFGNPSAISGVYSFPLNIAIGGMNLQIAFV